MRICFTFFFLRGWFASSADFGCQNHANNARIAVVLPFGVHMPGADVGSGFWIGWMLLEGMAERRAQALLAHGAEWQSLGVQDE